MFSFFKKVIFSILPWEFNVPEEDPKEDEQEIINRIRFFNVDDLISQDLKDEKELTGQSDTVQYEVKIFDTVRKIGKITQLYKDYGIIDNVIYFDLSLVSTDLVLKPNDEVVYSAYKIKDNEAERVFKIEGLKDDAWKFDSAIEGESLSHNIQDAKEIYAIERVITGRVTERKGREVYVESANIWCNLDKIQASYIPLEGDWIELHAFVSVCKDTADFSGEILEIKSLKPLLLKNGCGRVTFWSDLKKEGAIENLIYFAIISCQHGYFPKLGDEVLYEAVESDQERFRWRALKVFYSPEMSQSTNTNNKENNLLLKDMSDSFCDKNGISIVPSICSVEIEFDQTKNVTIEVINNGKVKQFLKHTKFQTRQNSQLLLLSPKLSDNFIIEPEQKIQYHFQCDGKILGLSGEVFFFYFDDFMIAKRFEINVIGNKKMNKLLECKFDTVFKNFKDKKIIRKDVDADLVLYGPRPWKPPKFISRERKCIFHIPQKLWDIVMENSSWVKVCKAVINYAPSLAMDLKFEGYSDRFHTLLYLEEIELKVSFRKYDLNGIFLTRKDDYFVLNVPNLVEKRPSLIVGDKVILMQSWSKSGKIKHVGYINHIRAQEIFIKFHSTFHSTYDESECNIFFEPCTNFFIRTHEAVNRVVKTLGEQWLFPSAVNEKPPLFNFDIPEESETLSQNVVNFFKQIPVSQIVKTPDLINRTDVTDVELNMKNKFYNISNMSTKKNLVWINEKLNERQKLAVVNVLEGRGRPLPYIIFGPPGTGKTVTLVEIILQIYRLLPESRILITTPSNSSADLICERLIELGNLKPGQFVRLIAIYRIMDGLVPTKLIPYSTVYNGKDIVGANQSETNFESKFRNSPANSLYGRQRITVATCVTSGILHYFGLQPGHFTHILIDEAGQTSEPEVLISASFQNTQNGQVILAGDPQQLGPVVYSKIAKKLGLGISLLQRLISTFPYTRDFNGFPNTSGFDPRFITKLNVNYRSVPEILSLPSQMFYNSDLIPMVSQTDSKEGRIIEKFNFEAENRSTPPAIIFHGIIGQNYQEEDSPSWYNPHEIWQVVFYIRKLYSIGLKNEDIGIVTHYAKQVHKLRTLLRALELSQPKIGSVEEFQGQERYVIILTTVRSSSKFLSSDINHSLGFVASPQRLNVALTRARALLIIVGNPVLLSRDPYWMNVVKYCVKNNSFTGCNLHSLNKFIYETDADDEQEVEKMTNVSFNTSCGG